MVTPLILRFRIQLVVSSLALVAGLSETAAQPPNFVVLVFDNQGYGDVNYHPHSPPEVTAPHRDVLARESVIRPNGYASGHAKNPKKKNTGEKKEDRKKQKARDNEKGESLSTA